jgi:hypothetical protein
MRRQAHCNCPECQADREASILIWALVGAALGLLIALWIGWTP